MRLTARGVLAALLVPLLSTCAWAEDWVVAKATGQVWHAQAQATPVSLGVETRLAPGDLVQTGPTGRVMLTRGSERILVSPNSVISLPKTQDKPGFTTILQQAGAIAIEAEKKDHKHFEVLTPYLAAVVKGTQFTVTVGAGAANVDVAAGKVEVADVKSGKTALVLPGQFARVGAATGLSLGGSGSFEPITQGAPRSGTPAAVTVPARGLNAPPRIDGGQRADTQAPPANVVRIEKALGPIALDIGTATAGLARSETGAGSSRGTFWKPAAADASSSGNGASNASANSNANTGSGSNSGAAASSASATGVAASSGMASGSPGVSGASVAASANGVGAGVNAGNAFGLNAGNGVGKAFGLSKKP